MNYETVVGAVLVIAAGLFFYATMETAVVGAFLVTVGAWALILPRFLDSDGSAAR